MSYKTEQEAFWAGEFGDEYIDRNVGPAAVASNVAMFGKILSLTKNLSSVIEFGANVGLNLLAMRQLLPNAELSAVEINQKAVEQLRSIDDLTVHHTSILDFSADRQRDFAFTKGVLIHINPQELPAVYDKLYQSARRYICVAEYYNPSPVEVSYRGHEQRLFKRDFAGELLDRFSDLSLLGYSFVYRRDNNFPQDDLTWFLLEKSGTTA